MKNKPLFLMTLFLPLLTACLRVPNITVVRDKNHKENVYIGDNEQLYYFGNLSQKSNQRMFELYKKSNGKPQRLIIQSNGGDVFLGMKVGKFIFDNQIDVEVNRLCLSSCANYIFTAAKNKYLNPDSILGWHGSSWQPDINEKVNQGEKWAVKWRKAEVDFFKNIHVNEQVTVSGIYQYKWQNYLKAYLIRTPISGFNYSIQDMKIFGIDNIFLTQNKWNWKKANKEINILRVKALTNSNPPNSISDKP